MEVSDSSPGFFCRGFVVPRFRESPFLASAICYLLLDVVVKRGFWFVRM